MTRPRHVRILTLLCAVALDLATGEPPNRWHPVAWVGAVASRLERAAPQRGRGRRLLYGAWLATSLTAAGVVAGWFVERALASLPPPLALLAAAVALKPTFSIRGLAEAAMSTERWLERGHLDAARTSLRALVSRPVRALDEARTASAAIESVAENLVDSVVAPALYYLACGLPGAVAYRVVNTLDAMIGYRGAYEELGKAAARLDDLLNLIPARLAALLIVGAAALGVGDGRAAWRTMLADHRQTASPNAGWPMSAAAGALRVQLEKVDHYRLGTAFPSPSAADIRRAVRLYVTAILLFTGLLALLGTVSAQRVRPPAS